MSVMLVIVFCSGLIVGTKARAIKAEMRATEDVVEKEAIHKKFMKIHGVSMVMNLSVLIMGIVVIFSMSYYVKM